MYSACVSAFKTLGPAAARGALLVDDSQQRTVRSQYH